jgi:ankyrin repeat protein
MRTDILRYTALVLLLAAGCKKESDDVMTPLHRAAMSGDVNKVQLLLRQGADIDAKDVSGKTPLFIVASEVHWPTSISVGAPAPEMIQVLLDNGANINASDKWGYSVLHAALSRDRTDVAEFLLAHGAYVQTQSQGGETPLHVAARSGWPRIVQLLVDRGAEVNAAARNGDTPLLRAIITDSVSAYGRYPLDPNHWEVVRFLIAKGTDVNAMNRAGETALGCAAKTGDLKLAQLLMDSGARPNLTAMPDGTPAILAMNHNHVDVAEFLVSRGAEVTLHLAAHIGDIEKAQALIQSGSDVNARGQAGETPLHMAVCGGHRDVAELLINSGADVNAQAASGWTALHEAAWHGHKDIAELLIARGAAVNAKTAEDRSSSYFPHDHCQPGTTPLHVAPKDVAEVLITHGANINAQDEMGDTPVRRAVFVGDRQLADLLMEAGAELDLHVATYTGRVEHVKRLIAAGADINAQDDRGRRPLHFAIRGGHADIVEILASSGADLNAMDYDDNYGHRDQTLLHSAARMNHADVARVLIAYGANVRAQDRLGKTPLHTAAYFGNTSVVEVLLAHSADPNAETKSGETALACAQEAGFADVARLLGGDASELASGPYRVVITDHNSIEAFVGPEMSVDEVWVPDEMQLKELEAAITMHLRERAAPYNEYERALTYLRRYNREYAGFTCNGKRYITCSLSYDGYFTEKPLANRFRVEGVQHYIWGPYKLLFDVGSETIIESTARDVFDLRHSR